MNSDMDLVQRLSALEGKVTRIEEKYLLQSHELRKLGLRNGSRGVAAGFVLAGSVFFASAIFRYSTGSELMPSSYFLILCGLIALALLAYFGFIFGFALSVKATPKELGVGTKETTP